MKPLAPCAGKNILVTGAGGYIGSALVKAIAACAPRLLTLVDVSEQNVFQLKNALDADFPAVRYQPVVGSVTDGVLVDAIFRDYRPQLIFHAAAYKHVELMELNPFAALMNNAAGTFTVAQAAVTYGCECFVLVSTDKAVRPHSVMGVSKRMAELITISMSRPDARMNAVRLCNISGSTGSVIPIFLEQMAVGQALTLTDPDATRCFLTIDEAIHAIGEAAVWHLKGNILMPRFHPPVRIADLAKSLVNGRSSYPFDIVGLRPGEKLSEDFVGPNEIEIESPQGALVALESPKLLPGECEELIQRLRTSIAQRNLPAVLDLLTSSVPDYVPSELMLSGAAAPRAV